MGKNKLARWAELGTFVNVIQPETSEITEKDHRIKGNWNSRIFRNNNPVILELGCGKGEYTVAMSAMFPAKNYIGIDIKGARMWRGAKTVNETGRTNVAFLRTRIEFLNRFFGENEVDEIWITFPDPHPGKRNSNKRLTCPWFLNKYRVVLKNRGIIHLKTDNSELYDYTLRLIKRNEMEIIYASDDLYGKETVQAGDLTMNHPDLNNREITGFITDNILSIRTHYENIFLKAGLKINYLAFRMEKEKLIHDNH